MHAPIEQGQNIAPIHAANAFVAARYFTTGPDDGEYSANPADYWCAGDDDTVGAIVGPITLRTVTGRRVTAFRTLREYGTVGDLRRLARAAASLVR